MRSTDGLSRLRMKRSVRPVGAGRFECLPNSKDFLLECRRNSSGLLLVVFFNDREQLPAAKQRGHRGIILALLRSFGTFDPLESNRWIDLRRLRIAVVKPDEIDRPDKPKLLELLRAFLVHLTA